MPANILIVDDEKHTREGLSSLLEETYEISMARDADEAFNLMEADTFDLVLTDLRMAGKNGLKVIDRALQLASPPLVIMMTAYGSVDVAVEAMKRGAFDFITKPLDLEKLEILIKRALQSRGRKVPASPTRLEQPAHLNKMVGSSPALKAVWEQVETVAPAKATVMLYGETGTGKELIAQMIHQHSPRAQAAFVPLHCAAIPANLLESELFGHEKGAFTGAHQKRIGRFEAADGGTLFLDEIGEIDPPTQVKLLRFLETWSFERLGSLKPIRVDVRLICATNKALKQKVEEGTFREDLYYRLNVIPISLPSLRQRREDVPLLIAHFLQQFASENALPLPEVTAKAMQTLQDYSWPGNIRELRNLCENLVVMKGGGPIAENDLDPRFMSTESEPSPEISPLASNPLKDTQSRVANQKQLLRNALLEAKGNRTKAAELMGVSRRTLHRKLAQWPELDV